MDIAIIIGLLILALSGWAWAAITHAIYYRKMQVAAAWREACHTIINATKKQADECLEISERHETGAAFGVSGGPWKRASEELNEMFVVGAKIVEATERLAAKAGV